MKRFAESMVEWLNKRGVLDIGQREVYVYGADLALYTLISTAGLLLVGALFCRFWETVLIVILYYTNQTIGGGYHATTHGRCFLTMLVFLVAALLTYYLPITHWIEYLAFGISVLVLECIPLTLHPNKGYLKSREAAFAKRSRLIAAVESLIVLALMSADINAYTRACCLGLLVSAISRGAGIHNSPKVE